MSGARALDVYRGDRLVGTLYDETPLRFRYADAWLAYEEAAALAPNIGLGQQDHVGDHVLAHFENLLPEGELRHLLGIGRHATTLFGLLDAVGGDTASGFSLLPHGETPTPAEYVPTTWEAIAARLRDPGASLLVGAAAAGARISLAGAQDKLLLALMPDGSPALPRGAAPSTHILKPDIRTLPGVWCSALNEAFVMRLAAKVGLQVAHAQYQPIAKACLIRRYDRVSGEPGEIQRLHQLDLCQLAGCPSTVKYESDGGPTLARCRELLQQGAAPAADLKRLVEWVFFNLCVGNNDSHAKNLSLLLTPDAGWRLAPFYDLMSTALYPGLSARFAFRIGGEDVPGRIERGHIEAMAAELGFRPSYVLGIGQQVAAAVLGNLVAMAEELGALIEPGSSATMLERLARELASQTRKLARRWDKPKP